MNRLGVVGCGVMGAGIAEIGAKGGCNVIVVDAFPEALENAKKRMVASLAKAEASGKLSESADVIMARIQWSTDIAALADCEIVTEAIRESLADKVSLIAQLDAVLRPDAIIDQHFFYPGRSNCSGERPSGTCPRYALLQSGPGNATSRSRLLSSNRSRVR